MKNHAKRLTAVFLAFSMIVNVPGQSVWAADMTEPTSGVRKETEIRSDESPVQEDREAIASAQEAQTVVEAHSLSEITPVLTGEAPAAVEEEILPEPEDVSEPEATVDGEETPELVVEEVAPVSEGLSGQSMETPAAASDDGLIADSLDYFIWSVQEDENGEAYISIDELLEANAGITSAVIPAEGSYQGKILPVRCIAHDTFFRAGAMTSVTIPASVREIGSNTFARLPNLREVVFEPNSELQTIGEFAFAESGITSITIPKSVSSMGQGVFRWCYDLETVVFEEGSQLRELATQTFYCGGAQAGTSKLSSITLPDNLETIGEYVFNETALPSIEIPASVKSIGPSAFFRAANLKAVQIQDGSCLDTIEYSAFAESALTSIALPASVTTIDEMAFSNTPDLEEVTFGDGAQLTTIRNGTFQESGLARLELPSSVETIETFAFFHCDNLQEIVFPEDSALTTIGQQAFQYTGMETVTIPKSVSEIGDSAFRACPNLKKVDFEEGSALRDLGKYVFSVFDGECVSQLETVNLPEGLETIGQQAFTGTAIRSIRIPASVRELGQAVFYDCAELETVEFPEDSQLTTIGNSVFGECGLKSITLPASLETLGESVFYGDYELTDVEFAEDAPNLKSLASYCFTECGIKKLRLMTYNEVTLDKTSMGSGMTVVCAYGSPLADTLAALGIPYEYPSTELRVTVQDGEGTVINSGYKVAWFYAGQEKSIGNGNTIYMKEDDRPENYSFRILLGEELGEQYAQPEPYTISGKDNGEVVIDLQPVRKLTVEGRVVDADGQAVAGAKIAAVSLINEDLRTEQQAETAEDGSFSVEMVAAVISLQISAEGFFTRKVWVTDAAEKESFALGEVTLYALPLSRVNLTVSSVEAVRDHAAEAPEEMPITDLDGFTFRLCDGDGQELPGVTLKDSALYLGENASEYAGQILTLHAEYPDGSMAAEDIQVQMNENCVGDAEVLFRENGRIMMEEIGGMIPAYVFVFDESGRRVESGIAVGSWISEPLLDGTYQVVLLQEQGYIREIQDIGQLDELGLAEGTDYISAEASVTNGRVTELPKYTVPEFDTSRFDYADAEKTYVKFNKSSVPVGGQITMRVSYALKEEYAGQLRDQKLVVPIPDGLVYRSGSATVNSTVTNSVTYDEDGGRLVVDLPDDSAIFRCLFVPVKSGSYTMTPYLTFEREFSDALVKGTQPLGEGTLPVSEVTILAPETTGKSRIVVGGTALVGSTVTIFDADNEIGSTVSKQSGSWQCTVDLPNPYLRSRHYIYAVVDSSEGITYKTAKKCVLYDKRFVDVSKVVMKNFGHREITTVWEFEEGSDTSSDAVGHYDYNPYYPSFTFQVYFNTDDPQALGAILPNVTVKTKGTTGAVSYVEAAFDETTGSWVGTGDFDYDTAPESLSVCFSQTEVEENIISYEEIDGSVSEYSEILDRLGINMEEIYSPEIPEAREDYIRIIFNPLMDSFPRLYMTIEVLDAAEVKDLEFTRMYDEKGNWIGVYSDFDTASVLFDTVLLLNEESACRIRIEEEARPAAMTLVGTDTLKSDLVKELKGLVGNFDFGLTGTKGLGKKANALVDYMNEMDAKFANRLMEVYPLLYQKQRNGNYALYDYEILAYDKQIQTLWDREAKLYRLQKLRVFDRWGNDVGVTGVTSLLSTLFDAEVLLATGPGMAVLEYTNPDVAKLKDMALREFGKYLQEVNPVIGEHFNEFLNQPKTANIIDKLLGMSIDLKNKKLMAVLEQECGIMQDNIDKLIDDIIAHYHEDPEEPESMPEMMPLIEPEQPSPTRKVMTPDPSGYVYEAVPGNRLAGVKASIYKGEREDEDSEWTWELWDAENYDEIQNQITGVDGTYGWDVPFGTWKVKYEKEGYESAESAEMEVPPEWTDVNIGMVSKAAPEVKYVNAYEERVEIALTQYVLPDSMKNGVTVTADGRPVSGTLEPLNLEENYEKTTAYASKYQFVPAVPLSVGAVLTVDISGVESYNGQKIDSYSEKKRVQKEIKEIRATDVPAVACREDGVLMFSLTDAGAGKSVQITNLMPSILELVGADADGVATVTANAAGMLRVPVKGLIPGTGVLRLELPEYGLELEQKVTVSQTVYNSKDIASCTVTVAGKCVYNGKAQKPAVTVNDGEKTLAEGRDYTVSYSDNVNAGTAKAVVTGTGNYTGTVTKTFTIAKAANGMTVSDITRTYKKKKQSVSVVPGQTDGAGLSYKSSNRKVTVSASGMVTIPAKFIGKTIITVTAAETANCLKTEKTILITVNPLKTKLSGVKSVSGRKASVKWKKTANVSGYQIQYSTDKSFRKGAKTVTVKGKSKTSGTIKKLKAKKTYYVRVRSYKTVSKVKYYSAWSKAKKVKIKK